MDWGPDGNLFVGSGANRAVYEFDGAGGGLVKVFASGNGLTAVIGVAFDEQGLLYVSSFSSNSVLRFDAQGSFVDQFVSPGAGGRLSGTHFFLFIDGPVATQRTSFGEFKEQFRP